MPSRERTFWQKRISVSHKDSRRSKDYYAISDYLIYMSDIYLKQNDWNSSFIYAQRSLELAKKYGLKEQLSTSNLKLSYCMKSRKINANH